MAHILFTHSYFLRYDPKQWKFMQPYPPLGTIYAASVMREAGYSVALFDTMFVKSPEEITVLLEREKTSFLVIYDDCFNYLTKMCLTNMRHAAFKMAALAKKHECKVIICSSDSTDHYDKYLNNFCDFVVIGEGEQTLHELIDTLSGKIKKNINEIEGIAYKNADQTIVTQKRAVLRDLDSLPFPAWDLININEYKKRWLSKYGYFSLNQVTTRGCPYKCNWCAKPIYGNRYNSRSPQKIAEELKILLERYEPSHIWFCDDIFGLKPQWIAEFAHWADKYKLKFKFKIQSRVDLLLVENTVEHLAKAGCETVWLGAESGSQKILDAMEKGTTVEQIYKAREVLKKYNIKAAFFLQFGYLGETKKDIDATIQMLLELMPDDVGISVSYPLPGTKFYDIVKNQLKEKKNWTDSDDLSLMFGQDTNKNYYKILQRYVHKSFQKKKGLDNIKMIGKEMPFSRQQWRSIFALAYYVPASFWYKKRFDKI